MTRRRPCRLVAGLSVAAGVALIVNTLAGGPVTGGLPHSYNGQGVLSAGAKSGVSAVDRPGHDARSGRSARTQSRHASRTGAHRSAAEAAGSGTEEAGEQTEVTRHVTYAGTARTEFTYPGASYVKVHFSRMLLRPGDWVTVSDPKNEQSYTYHADPRLVRLPTDSPSTDDGDGFWAMSINGESAVVTLHKTLPDPGLGTFGLDVDRVAHGFTSSEKATREANERKAAGGRYPESVCGNDDSQDAVCYQTSDPVAYAHSLPVARLLINGTTLCTAWRVTSDDRMLTNNHCLGSQSDVSNTEVWFNYQCASCGGNDPEDVTKVPGDQLLRTGERLDYTLFTVGDFASIQRFGYLGLDLSKPRSGEQVYIPQHPEGEPTKLSIASDQDPNSTCQVDDPVMDGNGHDTDTGYRCDTEPGASGSPVIDSRTNRVIALHHLGGCPNSGVRITLVYQQIKSLL